VSTPPPLRVLVTRPRHQASVLADLLYAAGALPILIPTIEIVPPASYADLDTAIAALPAFDWLLFTSANAVQVFAERAQPLQPATTNRIAVIGPATAKAVQQLLGRAPDLIPPQSTAESLAQTLLPHAPAASMLLVRAAVARDILPQTLIAAGTRLTLADAYRNQIPSNSIASLQALFVTNPPDAITFTSASTAQNLHALLLAATLTVPPGTILASIGPITSDAMRSLALEPTVEAPEATIASLVTALLDHVSSSYGVANSVPRS
jgi:uroporphyrinogen-III synthase